MIFHSGLKMIFLLLSRTVKKSEYNIAILFIEIVIGDNFQFDVNKYRLKFRHSLQASANTILFFLISLFRFALFTIFMS